VRERGLARRRQLGRREPAPLDEIVSRARGAARARGPRETEHDTALVRLEPVAEEVERLQLEARLLAHLAAQPVHAQLVLVQEAPGKIPQAGARIEGAPAGQHAAVRAHANGPRARHVARIPHVAAGSAIHAVVVLVDSLAADGTETPPVQSTHERHPKTAARAKPVRPLWSAPSSRCLVSPRAAGATQHELSRI